MLYLKKVEQFLSVASQFKLGELPTEQSHALTQNLSTLAKDNLLEAISLLQQVDQEALSVLHDKVDEIQILANKIRETIHARNKIFLCGCGATGRLALTLETLWRQRQRKKSLKERVCAFMAGGDVALIKSIENFEDYTVFGVKQLLELQFKQNDLFIGCTEGGETPFVVGATEAAVRLSINQPFFLYCNPDDILINVARRSKRILKNKNIIKMNCTTGPMAITGSTRMQASTVLMAAVGFALFGYEHADYIPAMITEFIGLYNSLDLSFLEKLIINESDYYRKKEFVLYETEANLGISILTDTTERSPTFSLHPFENNNDSNPEPSLCYIYFPKAKNSRIAWRRLLHREPRILEWDGMNDTVSKERLLGYDFSQNLLDLRKKRTNNSLHHHFKIYSSKRGIVFKLGKYRYCIPLPVSNNPLLTHLILKMVLNIHSTLVMGRLGRYEGNIMTWVQASNNKLIDRTIRYVDFFLKKENKSLPYEKIAHACFDLMDQIPNDRSLVQEVVKNLS